MIQLVHQGDEFRKCLSFMKFNAFEPRFDPRVLGEDPMLDAVSAECIPMARQTLVMAKQTGAWSLLEPGELDAYRRIRNIRLADFLQPVPEPVRDRAREFLVRLYWAGLIEIGGAAFFDSHVYDKGPITVPGHLFLIVPTERCNLACTYCFAEAGPSRRRRMSWKTARRIVDLVAEFPSRQATIEFAGGEALLEHRLITQIVTYAWQRIPEGEKALRFTAQTNGTLLRPGLLQLMKNLQVSLGLSLDGDPESNDKTRVFPDGAGTYSLIARALEEMARLNMRSGVICVVTRSNVGRLRQNLEAFQSLGVRSVKLNPVFRLGRAARTDSVLGIAPAEFLEMQKEYLDYVAEEDQPVVDKNMCHLLHNLGSRMHHYRCMRSQCGAGRDFFTFDPAGDIHACSRFRGHPEYRLGNVHETKSLAGLWRENPALAELQGRRASRIDQCRECLFQFFCQAGCPLDSHSVYGRPDAPHPWCDYYRGIYPALLQAVDRDPAIVGKLCPDIQIFQESYDIN
jgi:uncharacterized protein